jgi:hypothetical protein
MATKKSSSRKTSSGSGPKSKQIVKKKMGDVMHEFKHHQLDSGRSGKKVKNPKQAIAIGLSEARRSGADVPPNPNEKRRGKKVAAKKASKKSTGKKAAGRKTVPKKMASKRPAKKTAAKKR